MFSFAMQSSAQFKLRLVVTNNATLHKADPVFVAGNFNEWNPGDISYRLRQENNQFLFELQNLDSSVYEFKFTRGVWDKEACNLFGNSLGNIVIQLSSDSTVYLTIEAWKDDFPPKEKTHTALSNVRLVDTAFYIPQLNRSRKVMIYLPDGYEKSLKHYPVLYMHDGQNLFDEFLKRRGYDLANELPALFSKEKSEKNNRVLCDYRMTIDELILEKFTGEWQKWAHSKNKMVRNQSHGSPANTLDLYGVVDIPETEGTEILRIKFVFWTVNSVEQYNAVKNFAHAVITDDVELMINLRNMD